MKPYSYQANDAALPFALTRWTFESYSNCDTYVLPDGCCDFIVQPYTTGGGAWFISELSKVSYSVHTPANSKIQGIRLRPGVGVRVDQLSSWLNGRDPAVLFRSDQLGEFCTESENLSAALACLASGRHTVQCVATDLGVSLRTLQRLISAGTGQTPYFWLSLARIRKAGRLLRSYASLSEVAIEAGFADQAHMTREMRTWFGKTPNQIKSDPEVLDIISEPGYG